MDNYDLKAKNLDSLFCFHLYVCSKEIIKIYKPLLDKMDLTYTQLITMKVLWDKSPITSKEMGKYLYLDSGTLTPLLKKLEAKGLLTRSKDKMDERNLVLTITEKGKELEQEYLNSPRHYKRENIISDEELEKLQKQLYKVLNDLNQHKK